jgi:hypothetical protein
MSETEYVRGERNSSSVKVEVFKRTWVLASLLMMVIPTGKESRNGLHLGVYGMGF